MSKFTLALGFSVGACAALASPVAEAHFLLNAPKSWWSQLSDGSPQKTAPCGNEAASGTSASKVITNVQPGQTLAVQVQATVPHPGWYRISLKQGASSTQTTSSLPDPPTLGSAGSAQQCTPAFIDNPVWSPTQPVLADKLGLPAGSTSTTTNQSGSPTFNVTIPASATCTTASPCTLQVLMFMTDHPSGNCNYHHCADIAFASGGAGGAGHGGAAGSGGTVGPGTGGVGGGVGGRTGGPSGGSSGASGGTGGTSAGTGGTIVTATGGTTGTGGTTTTGTGGTLATGGSTSTGGTTGGAGSAGNGDDSSGGCSCTVGGNASRGALGLGLLLAAAAIFRRRKRKAGPSLR